MQLISNALSSHLLDVELVLVVQLLSVALVLIQRIRLFALLEELLPLLVVISLQGRDTNVFYWIIQIGIIPRGYPLSHQRNRILDHTVVDRIIGSV